MSEEAETNDQKSGAKPRYDQRLVLGLSPEDKDRLLLSLLTAVEDVGALINDSQGVTGLHLNGDVATWDELTLGGRNEDWLRNFGIAELHIETLLDSLPENRPIDKSS